MNIVLNEAILEADERTLRVLDQIIDRAEDEVHRLEIDGADRLQASSLYRGARTTRQKFLMTVASRPPAHRASRETHLKEVIVDSPASAHAAQRLAYSPLTILVEDREADGVLLEILIEKLASQEIRTLWTVAFNAAPSGLEIITAGGVNAMPDRVSRMVAETVGADSLRLIVVCDSDKRWPTDAASTSLTSITALQTLCAAEKIECHVLGKRTAENYVPDEVFKAAGNLPQNLSNRPRFDAFARRTDAQRDHFPVKDGLSAAERDAATAQGLYSAAEAADLALLEVRLFPKRPRLMLQLQKYHLHDFTAAGLRARDGAGELEVLLSKIAAEL